MNLHYATGDQLALQALVESTLALAPSDAVATAYLDGRTPLTGTVDGEALWTQGLNFTNQGRHLEAAVVYRLASEGGGALTADIVNNLGWSFGQLGFLELAIPLFEQALEHRPEFALAESNMNWAKEQLDQEQSDGQ